MKRLFELLFQNGVVLVTISNKMPEELYSNGIQRPSFLPFIPFLRQHNQVISVDTDQDFRLMLIDKERKFFSRLFYGKKLRKGEEKILQTYFCMHVEEDLEMFRYFFLFIHF
jgi:predicted ATPase